MELGDLLSLVFVAIVVLSVLSNIFSRDDDEPAEAPRPTDLNESGRTGQRPLPPPAQRTGPPVVTSERGAGTQGRMPQTVVTAEDARRPRERMGRDVMTAEEAVRPRERMGRDVMTAEEAVRPRERMGRDVMTAEEAVRPRERMGRDVTTVEDAVRPRERMGRDITVSEAPPSNREQVRDRSGRDRTARDEWVERVSPDEIARRSLQTAERAMRRRADDVPMDGEIGSRQRRRPAAAAALGTASPTMLLRRSLRDQTTVRRAFVVKELLDRPVGLRDEA